MKIRLLFFAITLVIVSCKKDSFKEDPIMGINVSFLVDGEIGEEETVIDNVAKSHKSTMGNNIQTDIIEKVVKGEEFDSYVFTEEYDFNTPSKKFKASSQSSGKDKFVVAPEYPNNYIPNGFPLGRRLTPGVTFRILIYDQVGNFVEEVNGTAGSSTAPKATNLSQGKTYNWFAYSYYSSDPLPAIPVSSRNNPEFPVENEDFLYASGSFTTPTMANQVTNTNVTIIFKHAMAMISLSVNLSSFNGKADYTKYLSKDASRPYIRVAGNTLKKGVFNLKSGAFSSKSLITSTTDAVARANYAFPYSYPTTSYQGFFYTAPDGDNDYINTFNTSIETWTILDRPASPKVFNKTYTHKVRSGRGKFTRISIYALDNGISVPSSSGATNWARGDLYYDDSQGFADLEGRTRFQHRNHEPNSIFYESTFQPYGVTTPTSSYGESRAKYGSTYYKFLNLYPLNGIIADYQGLPCGSLSPNGSDLNDKWRYPTVSQGRALAEYINANASNGRVSHTYNTTTKSIILTINTNSLSSPNEWSERLSFEMKGYAAFNTSTSIHTINLPTVTSSSQVGYAYIWLSPETGVSGQRAYLELYVNSGSNPKFRARIYRNDITSTSGIDFPMPSSFNINDAINIRCVRNF